MFFVKVTCSPLNDPLGNRGIVVSINVVGNVKPMANGHLRRLDITDVDYPNAICIAVFGQLHLVVGLSKLDGILPLEAPRITDIVKVVVDTCASGSLLIIADCKSSDILPVVIGPEKSNRFGNLHACFEIVMHLLVQASHVRHL